MHLFLIKEKTPKAYILEGDEAHHCIRVMRKKRGDTVHGINGTGKMITATIRDISKKEVTLDLIEEIEDWGEPPYSLRLALSPLRQRDRFEWAIEKAVELGVSGIEPVLCKRTVKTGLKESRIQNIAISALKQCKRSRLPDLPSLRPLEAYLGEARGLKLIAWCEAEKPIQDLQEAITNAPDIHLLIGPEGDFSEEEVAKAREAGFIAVSLGSTRLRTETAALYGLSCIKSIKAF